MIHKLEDSCGCVATINVDEDANPILVRLLGLGRCRKHRGRLYREGDAPHTGGDTSRAAARRVQGHLQRQERAVLQALATHAGHAEDVAQRCGMYRLSAGARLTVLSRCDPPLVRDSGDRDKLESGNPGVVWEITKHGREILVGGEQLALREAR